MRLCSPWLARTWTPLALVALLGCPAGGGDEEVGGTSETGESSTAGESESTTGSETSAEPLLVAAEVELHPNQPMVVDVHVTLREPGYAMAVHTSDPGVRVARLAGEGAAESIHLRVRGLAPAHMHELQLDVGLSEGAADENETLAFTTNPALPGYIAAFPLELSAGEPDPDYRFFDLAHLFGPGAPGMFMIDEVGRTRWFFGTEVDFATLSEVFVGLKLRDDGSVLAIWRTFALIYDELGNELSRIDADADLGIYFFHHDILELPSGNFLSMSWDFQDVDYGVDGIEHVAGDTLVEFTPAGEVVWTWNSFDHLDPQRRRHGFYEDLPVVNPATNEDARDWTHANGMLYADGIIYLSVRNQDWVLAIDHASGEVLWRLGDEGDFALADGSTWFFHQHSLEWQPDGTLMMYDNGVANPYLADDLEQTHAARYALDLDAMTAERVWQDDEAPFISGIAGDADRMSGGHVLRLDSTFEGGVPGVSNSRLRELDPAASPQAIWSLTFPMGHFAYRAIPTTRLVGEPIP